MNLHKSEIFRNLETHSKHIFYEAISNYQQKNIEKERCR